MDCSIIGMSIRLPKQLNEYMFWDGLVNGISFLDGMSDTRQELHENEVSNAWGNLSEVKGMYLDNIDSFDKKIFNLSNPALIFADPRQRLLIESCWSVIEDAGLKASELKGKKVGVFIAQDGFGMSSYFRIIPKTELSSQEFIIPGNVTSFLANRISNIFDFKGPSMVVDSTCSSVYVAIHHAKQALENGECDYALVGGATLFLEPWKEGEIRPTSFESATSEVKSFMKNADGYCSSEGCGMILIQRSHPIDDKKHSIYGMITGSGYNSGGKTRSFAQPNQQQQEALFRTVLEDSNKIPDEINYIESHGIGSDIGDAIEANALINIFGKEDGKPCNVSTIKPNIGHTHASSGLYSLLKALLSIKYKKITRIKGFKKEGINDSIPKETGRIRFLEETIDWDLENKNSQTRSVFLTSYGFSNTNAAIIIEEATPHSVNTKRKIIAKEVLICFSAMTKDQIREQQVELLNFIDTAEDKSIDLLELAYTLQVGREAFRYRFAAVVNTIDQLIELLKSDFKTQESKSNIFVSDTKNQDYLVQNLLEDRSKLDKLLVSYAKEQNFKELADLWLKGINIKWEFCYKDFDLRRLHLPVYPFATESYWISKLSNSKSVVPTNKIHPLVHTNSSSLKEQRFTSLFQGTETFLTDHVVKGEKVFPGVAYLELARVVGTISLEESVNTIKKY